MLKSSLLGAASTLLTPPKPLAPPSPRLPPAPPPPAPSPSSFAPATPLGTLLEQSRPPLTPLKRTGCNSYKKTLPFVEDMSVRSFESEVSAAASEQSSVADRHKYRWFWSA
jgi:hypothetical protein